MKKTFSLFILLATFVAALQAQFVPQGFNYQCVVRNAAGDPIANQSVQLLFAIKSGASNGPLAYAELHTQSTNAFGLANLVIGKGTPVQGSFSGINWGGGAKFVTVSLESSPGVFDELGTTEFQAVPYALYALNASGGGGGTGGDDWGSQSVVTAADLTGNGTLTNPVKIAPQNAQIGQVLKWNGTAWKPMDDIANSGTNGGTVTTINTGTGLVGGPISTSGTIELAPTGVSPGVYGSATEIPVLTLDATGRVTSIWKTIVQPGTIGITGAAGITVQQNGTVFTLTNTGDTNPNDDLTQTTTAGGDLSGTFSNLQLNPSVVTTTEIQDATIRGVDLNKMDALTGQVLKWNGTTWLPQNDETGIGTLSISGGAGIGVSGDATAGYVITNTGDPNPADDLTNLSAAGGDLSGTFSNLQIRPSAVGSAEITNNAILSEDLADAAVTSAKIADAAVSTVKIANGAVTTIKLANASITAEKLTSMGAASGQILKWNGTVWAPANDLTGIGQANNYSGGTAIEIIGAAPDFVINNLGDTDASDDLTTATVFDGDISGTFDNISLTDNSVGTSTLVNGAVSGAKIAQMNATSGQVLKWNGTSWSPAADLTGIGQSNSYTGGTAIEVTGTAPDFVINNLGDTDASDDLLKSTVFGGHISGLYNNIRLADNSVGSTTIIDGAIATADIANGAVTGAKIAPMNATNGQVLKWNGTTWVPMDDNTSIGTAGFWDEDAGNIFPTVLGNVLIGSPNNQSGKLQVVAANTTQEAGVFRVSTSASPKNALIAETSGTGAAAFLTSSGGPALVTGNGPVGIGLSQPLGQMHVKAVSNRLPLILEGDSPRIVFAESGQAANSTVLIGKESNRLLMQTRADSLSISIEPGGNPALFATKRNVSIGAQTKSDYRLRVFHQDSGFNLTNTTTGRNWEMWVAPSGDLVLYNDQLPSGVSAGTFALNGTYTPSDRRLKDEIRPYVGVLEKIKQMPAQSFQYKNSTERTIGFMAQDVQAVFPELVRETANRGTGPGYLAVNYGAMSAVAIQAIREQQEHIERLEAENKSLKTRLDNLEVRMSKLERN